MQNCPDGKQYFDSVRNGRMPAEHSCLVCIDPQKDQPAVFPFPTVSHGRSHESCPAEDGATVEETLAWSRDRVAWAEREPEPGCRHLRSKEFPRSPYVLYGDLNYGPLS